MGASLGVLVGSILVPRCVRSPIWRRAVRSAVPEIRPRRRAAGGCAWGRLRGSGTDGIQTGAGVSHHPRAHAEAADRNGVPNWLSTHPQPENRAARATETVKQVRAKARWRGVDDRSRRLSCSHRRDGLWRQSGGRRRARPCVRAPIAQILDRRFRKGGKSPTPTSRWLGRSPATKCSW